MVLRLWDYAQTILRSEKLQISYAKPEIGAKSRPTGAFLAEQMRKMGPSSIRRGFLGRANYKIHIRLRACRRPSIFSPAESAPPPNVRDVLFSLLQGADPLDPKAPQGPHPHPNPPRDPRGPKGPGEGGQGAKGTQRGPKGLFPISGDF